MSRLVLSARVAFISFSQYVLAIPLNVDHPRHRPRGSVDGYNCLRNGKNQSRSSIHQPHDTKRKGDLRVSLFPASFGFRSQRSLAKSAKSMRDDNIISATHIVTVPFVNFALNIFRTICHRGGPFATQSMPFPRK